MGLKPSRAMGLSVAEAAVLVDTAVKAAVASGAACRVVAAVTSEAISAVMRACCASSTDALPSALADALTPARTARRRRKKTSPGLDLSSDDVALSSISAPSARSCPSHHFDVSSANLTDADVEFSSATCVSAELTAVVKAKRSDQYGRKLLAAEWRAHANLLLDLAVDLFKERCTKEAEAKRRKANVSLEDLTRDLVHVPKRIAMNQTSLVD